MKNIVYMIGAESVGKTSVGSVLAMLLVGQFVECTEKDELKRILQKAEEEKDTWYVVELPSELVLAENNMDLMRESGIVILLMASGQELAWRASGCPEPEEEDHEAEEETDDIDEDEINVFDSDLLNHLSEEQQRIARVYQKGSGVKLDTTSLDIMEVVQILHMILTQ